MNLRRLQQNKVCPRCGSKLVLRVAKKKAEAKCNVETLCTSCKNRVICKYYDKVKELTLEVLKFKPEFDIPDRPFDISIKCEFHER